MRAPNGSCASPDAPVETARNGSASGRNAREVHETPRAADRASVREMAVDVVASEAVDRPRLSLLLRAIFGACGAALLIGFFMPWFLAGALLSLSGFALVFSSGQMVGLLSGANRFLLFAVPLLGLLLVGGSILGHRLTTWVAVGGSAMILLFGLFSLVRVFMTTTGVGMWLVIVSALLSLCCGLIHLGRGSAT